MTDEQTENMPQGGAEAQPAGVGAGQNVPTSAPVSAPEAGKQSSNKVILMVVGGMAVFGILFVVLMVGGFLLYNNVLKYANFEEFESENYSIKYHKDWDYDDSAFGTQFLPKDMDIEDEDGVAFLVMEEDLPAGEEDVKFDDYIDEFEEGFEEEFLNYSDAEQKKDKDVKLDGKDARRLEYEFEEDGDKGKILIIWTLDDGVIYTIMYAGTEEDYDDYKGTADKMIDSFKIAD